jgi:malonyl-CoA O-methyltransferase
VSNADESAPGHVSGHALDTSLVRRYFERAAATYDAAAVLHTAVRATLLERLDFTALKPQIVVDAGAGTGHGSRALKQRYPKALVLAIDTSLGMLRAAARQRSWLRPFLRIRADAERLPLPDGSVDLIMSNLMLQWCDPDAIFAEFRRVLAPQGLLSIATLGPDTLRELRTSWAQVDCGLHVNQFIDMHDLGDALMRAGFAAPVLDVERITLTYADVQGVTADLKATGARNAMVGRSRGLTGVKKFAAFQTAYETFRQDGRLPATYEVVFGHAWAPRAPPRRGGDDGSTVSLEEIKRQLRSRRVK